MKSLQIRITGNKPNTGNTATFQTDERITRKNSSSINQTSYVVKRPEFYASEPSFETDEKDLKVGYENAFKNKTNLIVIRK